MTPGWSLRKLSLKTRLISSYLVILATGGLATSLVGSWIVSSTIMMQARRVVDHDFATTKTAYDQQVERLKLAAQFAASSAAVREYFAKPGAAAPDLESMRGAAGFDFVGVAVPGGSIMARFPGAETPVEATAGTLLASALAGRVVAGTELVTARESGAGVMAMVAAAPVDLGRGPVGAVYGGKVLNGNSAFVDEVWNLLYRGDRFPDVDPGSVTVFFSDARVATTVRTEDGSRAIGTIADDEVRRAVLVEGRMWRGRTFVVKDWHIGEYAPIRDLEGRAIGMLSVGILESTYAGIRNRVILSFFGIATLGFLLILGITYYMIGNITRPLGEMVLATRNITAGRFDHEAPADAPGEIALLAASFNAMLKSLRQMKSDLEEWGRTLEQKVRQRTEELTEMQARVAQSERLASLGMLAAGVAHEVNNPLGAILALTTLTAEDLAKDDPSAENLAEVVRQTERCRDIVKGLLQFSRQSKGVLEPVDLNQVLRDTLALIGKQAMFFNVAVVCEFAAELPAVPADRSQMQQVFLNVLMNAVQAMDERGKVTIATRYDGAAGLVEVAISDTGRGIPAEQIDRIFDPFFTTKESGRGTGLGLSIAYGIVTTHGGSISVASEAGKGSTFLIRMPEQGRRAGDIGNGASEIGQPADAGSVRAPAFSLANGETR